MTFTVYKNILTARVILAGALALLLRWELPQAQVFDFPMSTPLELQRPLDDQAQRLLRNASIYENRGDSEKALQAYWQLFSRYPEYDPFYEGIVRNVTILEQFERGLQFTDSLRRVMAELGPAKSLTISEQERLANVVVDAGRFAGRLGRREEAERRWDELYAFPHPTANAFIRLFSALIECRYVDWLEEMTQRARKASGDPTLLAASLANYWAEHERMDKAVAELLLLLELQPHQADNIARQILNFSDDETSRHEVETSLIAARSRQSIRLQVSEILQAVHFRNREWEKAYQEVRQIEGMGGGSGDAMLTFAETLIAEAESQLALRVLNDLGREYPDVSKSPRAKLALGKALESARDYARADSVYGVLTSSPNWRTTQEQEALLAQARLKLTHLHQPAAARELLTSALERNPRLRSRGEITILIGDSYLTEGDLGKSRDTYLQAASAQPGSSPEIRSQALVSAAHVDLYEGQFVLAAQRLEEASRSNPESALTNDALNMLELLRLAAQDSVGLADLCRANLQARLGKAQTAESLYSRLSEAAQNADIAREALVKLALLLRDSGRAPEAVERLDEALRRFPQSLKAPEYLLLLGRIREEDLSDTRGAIEAYEKILIDFPTSLAAQDARRRIRRLEKVQT
jgi:tetratricopeptide (TPR) repeat protein